MTKQSFVFSTSKIWNDLLYNLFAKCQANKSGIVIPGKVKNSGMSASMAAIKSRIKEILLKNQKSGSETSWSMDCLLQSSSYYYRTFHLDGPLIQLAASAWKSSSNTATTYCH